MLIAAVGHYKDEGMSGPGGQGSNTFPQERIYIFDTLDQARDYSRTIRDSSMFRARKNPSLKIFSDNKYLVELGFACGEIIDLRSVNSEG